MASPSLTAPFPYFGGKRRIAPLVWRAFGNAPNYVEPFAGSLAVLLARPHEPKYETINDADAMVANFWRATQAAPVDVARHADWPVNEADLHARGRWLLERAEFRARMHEDAEYYDTRIAGWWAWGVSTAIGGDWPSKQAFNTRPHMSANSSGGGVHSRAALRRHLLRDWLAALSERLRRVRIACGDWSRVLSGFVTGATYKRRLPSMSPCAIFLDPPYAATAGRKKGLYATDDVKVAHLVRDWAIANGDNSHLRIALCGYEGEHEMPGSWRCVAWKTDGGYGKSARSRGARNASRERIWFSPACLAIEAEAQTRLAQAA